VRCRHFATLQFDGTGYEKLLVEPGSDVAAFAPLSNRPKSGRSPSTINRAKVRLLHFRYRPVSAVQQCSISVKVDIQRLASGARRSRIAKRWLAHQAECPPHHLRSHPAAPEGRLETKGLVYHSFLSHIALSAGEGYTWVKFHCKYRWLGCHHCI